MERTAEVKTIKTSYICDDCEKGEMLPSGQQGSSNLRHPHTCSQCGHVKELDKVYPIITYQEA